VTVPPDLQKSAEKAYAAGKQYFIWPVKNPVKPLKDRRSDAGWECQCQFIFIPVNSCWPETRMIHSVSV